MFLRTLAVWVAGLPITVFFFFLVLVSFLFDRHGTAVRSIGALWCRTMLALAGVRVEVKGVENIPKGSSVIFVSNHQGAFDIPALQGYIPVQFRWIAKKSLFKIPALGLAMRLAGYIAIERENARSAYRSITAAAEKIRKGASVLIFPEGTRSPTGKLLPFKRGGLMLAVKSAVPVVPVAIQGTGDIMRRGGFLIRPSRVSISIGRPLSAAAADEKELAERARAAIERLLA